MRLNDEYSLSLIQKLKKYDLDQNIKIRTAMVFAKKYHEGQFRKSGEVYYMHPVAVAEMVLPHNQKEDVIVSALLHDVVEDTDATIEMLEKRFGSRVVELVHRLTRIQKGEKLSVQTIIDASYIAKDKEALLIKVCDRLHNLKTYASLGYKSQMRLVEETIDIFIVLSAYLGLADKEEEIIKLCKEILQSHNNAPDIKLYDRNLIDLLLQNN